jgi:hypothetical protein
MAVHSRPVSGSGWMMAPASHLTGPLPRAGDPVLQRAYISADLNWHWVALMIDTPKPSRRIADDWRCYALELCGDGEMRRCERTGVRYRGAHWVCSLHFRAEVVGFVDDPNI